MVPECVSGRLPRPRTRKDVMRGGEARPEEQEASSAQEGEGRPRAEVTLQRDASSQHMGEAL